MKKICLIIPYFGKLPNYFPLWLESAKKNPTVDFLLITDNKEIKNLDNIHVYNMTFQELKERVQKLIKFKISLDTPYKLCDFRPVYGEIFFDYLKEYDFWGYCDIDLIFGNIRKFITPNMLKNYEKINMHGHFSLYENTKKMRTLYKKTYKDVMNYKIVFKTNLAWHFDEFPGISYIIQKSGGKWINMEKYADLDWTKNRFVKVYDHSDINEDPSNIEQGFFWKDGALYNLILNTEATSILQKQEIMYVHLQKRNMKINISDVNSGYYIVPNMFTHLKEEEVCETIHRYAIDGDTVPFQVFKKECRKNRIKKEYWIYKLEMLRKKK